MGLVYNKFFQEVSKGLSQKNRFLVEILLPEGLSSSNDIQTSSIVADAFTSNIASNIDSAGLLSLFCFEATLPTLSLDTFETSYAFPISHPRGVLYEPITFSFLIDENWGVYKHLIDWFDTIANRKSNTFNFYDEYISTITISLLDNNSESKMKVKLKDAYIISISGVELSQHSKNEATTGSFTVTFGEIEYE